MIETYYLNQKSLPTIPCPHDAAIKEVKFDKEYLTFVFDKDITRYDSVRYYHKDAKRLEIRMHLVDSWIEAYKYQDTNKGYGYIEKKRKKVFKKINKKKNKFEYLYHHVSFQSMVIELWKNDSYILKVEPDFVEFHWTLEGE